MADEGTCSSCQQGWDAEVRAAQLQQENDRLRRAIAGYTERSARRPYSEAKLKRALSARAPYE